MPLPRRLALLLPLWASVGLGGCDGGPPLRTTFPPLRTDYLTPLQLGVGTIDVSALPPPNPLDELNPAPPGPALAQLVRDRLVAAGGTGKILVTLDDATIARGGDTLVGNLRLRLDISGADGSNAGYAEARVTRRLTGIDRDLRGALYDLTKQMLDAMNVELEFQLKQNLHDLLQAPQTAPAPAPVEQQDLAPPS